MLDAADRYRDETSPVTSMEEWRAMADAMGLSKMGGAAPIGILQER